MTNQASPGSPGQGDQDPWAAFGYLVAGVAFYGVLGWVLGRWLHAAYLVPIGIVLGAVFGIYLVFARYRYRGDEQTKDLTSGTSGATSTANADSTATTNDHDGPEATRPDRDDRGDEQ